MPFISVNTSKKVTEQQKDQIKTFLGQNISILSGKVEQKLMVMISDSNAMYFGGEKKENLAFVDIRLYHMISFEDKNNFTKAVFNGLNDILGLEKNEIFLNFVQLDTWGTLGSLK